MSGIRGKNTTPELIIRKGLHAMGFRFRLHAANLPGKPDLVLPRYNAVILVNGCFWHGHDCHLFKWPSTRTEFWKTKITRNKQKDSESLNALRQLGWRVLVVWECSLKGKTRMPAGKVIEKAAEWIRSERNMDHIKGKSGPQ